MASPHSLPYSASVPTINFTNRPSQLPSSLSTVGVSSRFEGSPVPGGRLRSGSGSTGHKRSGSNISSASRARPTVEPQSPSRKSFGAPASTSTHAAGILPSASFFRPSRPNQPPLPYLEESRRSSVASSHGVAFLGSSLQLQPLPQDVSYDSDASGSMQGPTSDMQHTSGARTSAEDTVRPQLPAKHTKYSREPLLPVGMPGRTRAGSVATQHSQTKPSLSKTALERSAAKTSTGAGARVRDSFERLTRGLSLEIVRRSLSGSQTANGRTTFEAKRFEDEVYKASASPPPPLPSTSFIPYPPGGESLSAVPRRDAKNVRFVRNHELHPSRNRWLFGGRMLTGGDSPWAFIGTLALVFGISGVWFGTTCVWWWHNESPAVAIIGAYMCLLTISLMLSTAFTDPGILPRNLDPDPPYPATSPSDGGVRVPLPRDLKLRSGVVRVKYCTTCQTYRPPRSSHCKMCDNCVDGCDHHCQWVNNCVGRRNYTYFFSLLLVVTLTLCLVIVTSALHLYLLTRMQHLDFRHAISSGAGSAVAFSISVVVIWPVGALLSYHMRLLFLNITTIEQIRNSAHKSLVPGPPPPNPFAHSSWRGNVADVLCRPGGFSWLQPRAVATEDKRAVNPGLAQRAYPEGYDVDLEGAGNGGRGF
ncbi:hypothetical protein BV25DRAFT_1804263 [Artomyces pyxidatus]|uniref:Uncharacterized protein n=1 Tax=Artomyces pyxidatus TaxID=48021 RepID=A0ACB8T1R5_9AGAM|nr:hypothetical protein BV25DRAFT_1804263 [Artomyces pyxidatus]